jgi:folate-dependent phosphoribosylglycinamide formyltransferase PurN
VPTRVCHSLREAVAEWDAIGEWSPPYSAGADWVQCGAMRKQIAVLASGGGSNLQSIVQHLASLGAGSPADVVLVASDRPDAGALQRGRGHGMHVVAMDREQRTSGMLALLARHAVDLVVLAGYLRFVPVEVTRSYRGRQIHCAAPRLWGRDVWAPCRQ